MKLLKIPEVADILNVSEQHIYNLIRRGELQKTKIGGATRIKEGEVKNYIDENTGNLQDCLTTKEAWKKYFNDVHERTVQRWAESGKLPAKMIKGKYMIKVDDIQKFKKERGE